MLRHFTKYFKPFLGGLGLLIIVSCGSTSDVSDLPNNHLEVGSVANNPGKLIINNIFPADLTDSILSIWSTPILNPDDKDFKDLPRDVAMITGTRNVIKLQLLKIMGPGQFMANVIENNVESLQIDGTISLEVEAIIRNGIKFPRVFFDLSQYTPTSDYWHISYKESSVTEDPFGVYLFKPEIINKDTSDNNIIVPTRGALMMMDNQESSDSHQVLSSLAFENNLNLFSLSLHSLVFDGTSYMPRLFMFQCDITQNQCVGEFQTVDNMKPQQPRLHAIRYTWAKGDPILCLATVIYGSSGATVSPPIAYNMNDMTVSPEACTIDIPPWANTPFSLEGLSNGPSFSNFEDKMDQVTPDMIDAWLIGDFTLP